TCADCAPDEAARRLHETLTEGLVVPIDDAWKYAPHSRGPATPSNEIRYRFLHDRVQQAAYAVIGADHTPDLHLRIGRRMQAAGLIAPSPEQALDDRLFEIVGHLNAAGARHSDTERTELAELNLRAGRKAKQSGAFSPAHAYLSQGLKLVGETGWRTEYRLC